MGKTIDLQKWAEKMEISTSDLAKIKSKAGKRVSTDNKLLLLYEYMIQLPKPPKYDKNTYKNAICDVQISKVADNIAEDIDTETLIALLTNKLAPVLSGWYQEGYEYPIVWGSSSKKYRSDYQIGKMDSDEEYYDDFLEFITDASNIIDPIKHMERILPYCRYAKSEKIIHIIKFVDIMEKESLPRLRIASIVGRSGLLLSDTDEAKEYLDKHGLLHKYNAMRE